MTYSVKYKLPGQWLWRSMKNVKGNEILPSGQRCFYFDDGAALVLPMQGLWLEFSPEFRQQHQKNKNGNSLPRDESFNVSFKAPGMLRQKKIKAISEEPTGYGCFCLTLFDGRILEIPAQGLKIQFYKDRFKAINDQIEQEAGQKLPTQRGS